MIYSGHKKKNHKNAPLTNSKPMNQNPNMESKSSPQSVIHPLLMMRVAAIVF
jgi:hypothetical protein